jgi:hypothetical protein
MTCKNGHLVPDKALACPTCANERGEKALQGLQPEFLKRAAKGQFSYSLRMAKGTEHHVLLYTSFTRTFCGQELKARATVVYTPYTEDGLAKVCTGCRIGIKSAMGEAVS